MDNNSTWKRIIWVLIVLWVMVILGMGIAITKGHAQVTPGTVFSKTEDGNGNKITSTVVGPSRGLDVNVIAGGGSVGVPYLDADAIVNQTTTAIHGQTYMYNGATWDRIRGDTTNGIWVNCKNGCSGSGATFGAAFPATGSAIGFIGATGNLTGGSLTVNGDIRVSGLAVIDSNNSTTTPLAANGVFTGTATDMLPYAGVIISIDVNVGSAVGGMSLQWSQDNVNWDIVVPQTITAAVAEHMVFGRRSRYFRIVYTNGGTIQGSFRLQTMLAPLAVPLTHTTLSESVDANDTGVLTKSVIVGLTTGGGGGYVPVKVNPSGALTADVTQATSPWIVTANAGTNLNTSALLLDATFTGRFPVAYVDADTIANQTTTAIHGQCYMYNGATWDRCRGAVATGLLVNVSNASLAVTQSGTWNIGTLTTLTSITNPVAVTQSGAWSTGRTWTLSSGTDSVAATVSGTVAVSNAFLLDATFTGRWTAASLDADAIANETTTSVHGKCYLYNGASWDRCRGAVSTGLLVNVSNTTLAVTQSGTWNIGTLTSITNPVAVTGTFFQATQPVSIAATVTIQGAKTNNNAGPGATNIGVLPCVANAAAPTYVEGNQVACSTDLAGNVRITGSLATSPVAAATATVTQVGAVPGNVTLLVASGSRSSCMIHNESDYALYIKMGAVAQMNSFSAMIPPRGDWTCPIAVVYRGQIDATWEQVDGFAMVTDIP